MSTQGLLGQWCARVYAEEIGFGAVIQQCCRRGASLARARDIADDAVQYALLQAAEVPDAGSRFHESFEYFCNWVRRTAINYAHEVFRRERRKQQLTDEASSRDAEPVPSHLERAREFLATLSHEERALLVSPFEEGRTLDDLARRWLPADDRTENARRLAIWRRQRILRERLRRWMDEEDVGRAGDGNEPTGMGGCSCGRMTTSSGRVAGSRC